MTRTALPARTSLDTVAALLLLFLLQGCAHTLQRELVPPEDVKTLDGRAPYLKVHHRDGTTHVLSEWHYDEEHDAMAGYGQHLDLNRVLLEQGYFAIPRDSVALFETNTTKVSGEAMFMTIVTGVSVAMTIYCINNPKACFGSCPTFYVSDSDLADSAVTHSNVAHGDPSDATPPTSRNETLVAEGFSASVAPSLEATDIDALTAVRCRDARLRVEMRNEALETHVVRHVDMLAVPRPPGGRVFATGDGTFWLADPGIPPDRCTAPEGNRLASLRQLDGVERFSTADSTDLATREVLTFEYTVETPGDHGLVLASRQTLLSTFLLYQTLAWMGNSAGSYIATLERADPVLRKRLQGLGTAMGTIEVYLEEEDGSWSLAGETHETGPLATDVRLVPLRHLEAGTTRIQLRMTRGYWRLDSVQLARVHEPVQPLRIPPCRVLQHEVDDPVARAALLDPQRFLTTLPGDNYTLEYELPRSDDELELFLESRGYYLEWMREEWMKEEDPAAVARLFFDPQQALRDLAPAFKRVEPLMEDHFWGSRYVR